MTSKAFPDPFKCFEVRPAKVVWKTWNQIDLEAGSPFAYQPLLNASKYLAQIGFEAVMGLLNKHVQEIY